MSKGHDLLNALCSKCKKKILEGKYDDVYIPKKTNRHVNYVLVKKMYRAGFVMHVIAERFGITRRRVWQIIHNKYPKLKSRPRVF